jgi:hypothetical protein
VFIFIQQILVWKTNFDCENLLREFPHQQHETHLKEPTCDVNSPVTFQVDARKVVMDKSEPDIHVSWNCNI